MKNPIATNLLLGALALGPAQQASAGYADGLSVLGQKESSATKTTNILDIPTQRDPIREQIQILSDRDAIRILINQTITEHPELTVNEETKEKMLDLLQESQFQESFYNFLKKHFAWSTKNIVLSLIYGLLYAWAYSGTIRDSRKWKYLNAKAFAIFWLTSLGSMILNGFVPGSLVYAESFFFAATSIGFYLYNRKKWITKESDFFEQFAETAPFPLSGYTEAWYPYVWNPKMAEETWFSHEDVITHYEEEKKRLPPEEWPLIVMKFLYRGKNLEKVEEYLAMKKRTWKWYNDITFTMDTKSGEEKTFTWWTHPNKNGRDTRIAMRLTDIDDIKDALEKTEKLVQLDELTGAYRRGMLDKKLWITINHIARRVDNPGIVILDIDDFKLLNESKWHTFGDKVLREFAQFVQSRLRKWDTLYRYGWDEFAILFNGEILGIVKHMNEIRSGFFRETWIGSSWWVMPINKEMLSVVDKTHATESIKQQVDDYMLAVKHWRLIEASLQAQGKIAPNQNHKNGVAMPIYDHDTKELVWIEVRSEFPTFTISANEWQEICREKSEAKNVARAN